MADYIYLMQNRLTPAQWRALETVREAARAHNMPVFLVGGAVRDLTSGSPVRDLDFAVQGDAGTLREELEGRGGVVAGENASLSSLYLTFRGGVRVEIGPTLSVSYPKPGQPVTEPAVILDDLRRRDFTANAMAVSLNEGSYGLLLDPLNGTADIENREFRLVSAYGFIEQPALLLRAARLSERLGWSLEERTATRYQNSKDEGHIEALPAADRGYELEELFHEEDPVEALAHLEAEGWRDALFASLQLSSGERGGLDEVREVIGQMEGQGLHPDPSAVFFPLVTAKLKEADLTSLKASFPRQGFVRQIETLESRSKELAGQLTARTAAAPSETWRILMEADPEVMLYLAVHTRTGAVANKIRSFLRDWPQMRQKIPYALMQEMRITPELPGYDKLLDDLFFALIDGKLDTAEATRAFLEPFSPPAPPQVAVRRRPAKATRTRTKRAAEDRAEKRTDDDLESDSTDDTDERDSHDSSDRGASLDEDDEEDSGRDDAIDEEEDEEEPAPVKAQPVARVVAAPADQTPNDAPSTAASGLAPEQSKGPDLPRTVKKGAADTAANRSTPSEKGQGAAQVAAKTAPSKATADKTSVAPAVPSGSAKKPTPAAKTAPGKSPAKPSAPEVMPAKSVARKIVVVSARPAKAVDTKAGKQTTAAVPAKKVPVTAVPVKAKAVAKTTAPVRAGVPARPQAAAKKTAAPVKAAKKSAIKGRSR